MSIRRIVAVVAAAVLLALTLGVGAASAATAVEYALVASSAQ